ncbi:MAG: hypothetical protein MJZ94_07095 [Bacteroidales bacterium]|nr:hypothetical protein [Bacteroidales bacterium]
MKKLVLTIAVVLGMTLGASAQYFANNDAQPNQGGGLFGRGNTPQYDGEGGSGTPLLPLHGQTGNQDAPLGSGALLLIGFGAAYAASKRRKE